MPAGRGAVTTFCSSCGLGMGMPGLWLGCG